MTDKIVKLLESTRKKEQILPIPRIWYHYGAYRLYENNKRILLITLWLKFDNSGKMFKFPVRNTKEETKSY